MVLQTCTESGYKIICPTQEDATQANTGYSSAVFMAVPGPVSAPVLFPFPLYTTYCERPPEPRKSRKRPRALVFADGCKRPRAMDFRPKSVNGCVHWPVNDIMH